MVAMSFKFILELDREMFSFFVDWCINDASAMVGLALVEASIDYGIFFMARRVIYVILMLWCER